MVQNAEGTGIRIRTGVFGWVIESNDGRILAVTEDLRQAEDYMDALTMPPPNPVPLGSWLTLAALLLLAAVWMLAR